MASGKKIFNKVVFIKRQILMVYFDLFTALNIRIIHWNTCLYGKQFNEVLRSLMDGKNIQERGTESQANPILIISMLYDQ